MNMTRTIKFRIILSMGLIFLLIASLSLGAMSNIGAYATEPEVGDDSGLEPPGQVIDDQYPDDGRESGEPSVDDPEPTKNNNAVLGTLGDIGTLDIGPPFNLPGQALLSRYKSTQYTYRFEDVPIDTLADKFRNVVYDDVPYPGRVGVHGNEVGYYYIAGSGGNRAAYCFEPDNPYIDVEPANRDPYNVNKESSPDKLGDKISAEERDMLGYILADGVTEYTGENPDQIATQLAVWMVGTGNYDNEFYESMLPSSGLEPGVAPNVAIRDEARRLINNAFNKVNGKPSFLMGTLTETTYQMYYDGTEYTVTLTDTKGVLENSTEWGDSIIAQITAAGLGGTIDDNTHTLTITGDPTTAGKTISVVFDTTSAKTADIVFLESPINGGNHQFYEIRQQLITVNTLNPAIAGMLKLFREEMVIGTKAKDGGTSVDTDFTVPDEDQYITPDEHGIVKITDTVSYSGLKPGDTYTMVGKLMYTDGTTATEFTVGTPAKSVVEAKKFSADSDGIGTVTMDYSFNIGSIDLTGKSLVVFEKLFIGDVTKEVDSEGYSPTGKTPLTEHEEPGDEDQTVYFPKIGTTAYLGEEGTQNVIAEPDVVITDKVKFNGLVAGKSYTLTGTLKDRDTGNDFLVNGGVVTQTWVFTPDTLIPGKTNGSGEAKADANGLYSGYVLIVFDAIDASSFAGTAIVVFEDLAYNTKKIAVHADIKDRGQTIIIMAGYISCEVDKDTIKRTSAALGGVPNSSGYDNVGDPQENYRYDINFRSTSNVDADEFVVDDPLESVRDGYVRVEGLWTPAVWGDIDGRYNIWYKTKNGSGNNAILPIPPITTVVPPVFPTNTTEWKLWTTIDQENLNGRPWNWETDYIERQVLGLPSGLASGDYITAIRFEFGPVKVGFTSKNYGDEVGQGPDAQPMNKGLDGNDNGIRNTNGSQKYVNSGDIAPLSTSMSVLSNPTKGLTALSETDPGSAIIALADPSIVAPDIPKKGTQNDWSPVSTRSDYSPELATFIGTNRTKQLSPLKPATYLVSAPKPMQTTDIVSSAAAYIALGGANGGLFDQDQDAVLTREIVTFTANPNTDTVGSVVEENSFVENLRKSGLVYRNGKWYSRNGNVVSTGDVFGLGAWTVAAIVMLICIALLLRSFVITGKRKKSHRRELL